MTNLTQSQLQRIRDGATLVAVPMGGNWNGVIEQPRGEIGRWNFATMEDIDLVQVAGIGERSTVLDSGARYVQCPCIPGESIATSLPGLTWGDARAVRADEVTHAEALRCGLSDFHTGEPECGAVGSAWVQMLDEFKDAEWLWLVEAKRP